MIFFYRARLTILVRTVTSAIMDIDREDNLPVAFRISVLTRAIRNHAMVPRFRVTMAWIVVDRDVRIHVTLTHVIRVHTVIQCHIFVFSRTMMKFTAPRVNIITNFRVVEARLSYLTRRAGNIVRLSVNGDLYSRLRGSILFNFRCLNTQVFSLIS